MASYYDILGVPKNATQEQIKNGYREQIKFFHPDVFQGAPEVAREKTLQLNEAYAILRDPTRRREYDLHLEFERKKAREAQPGEPSEAKQEAPTPEENSPENGSPNDNSELFRICPNCGRPVSINACFCRCGCCPPSDSPVYHRCPVCGRFTLQIQNRCQCGYSFASHADEKHRSTSSKKAHRFGPQHFLIAGLLVVLLAVFIVPSVLTGNSDNVSTADVPTPSSGINSTTRPSSATSGSSPSALPSISLPSRPESGHVFFVNKTARDHIAPLTIVTRGSNDYYVKLRYSASKVSCLEFYVRGGETVDIDVPLGTFELVYATGSTWYGETYLFGFDTTYHKADDLFKFYDDGEYINGWTIELYLQSNGNLDTEIISADEF